MAVSTPDQRLPFVRILQRGLGLPAYFEAADRALARLVPFEASCWLSLDPGTMLPTTHYSREYGFDHLLELAANEFLEDDVNKFADLARATPPVGVLSRTTGGHPSDSRRHAAFLTPHGFGEGDELRVVFRDGDRRLGCCGDPPADRRVHRGRYRHRRADRRRGGQRDPPRDPRRRPSGRSRALSRPAWSSSPPTAPSTRSPPRPVAGWTSSSTPRRGSPSCPSS